MSTATDEARAHRLEQMHEALVAKTEALATSEGWLEYLSFAARFRQYSLNNTLLILLQMPEASRVASYKKWLEVGRQVRKGEKSLQIFAPMTRSREDKKTGEERRYVSGFRLVPVFDVSQTDGDPLPEQVRPVLLDGQAPEGLWESLESLVTANGYTVERVDCGRANGVTIPALKVIRVRPDVSDLQAVKTLAHEVGHMLLHCEGDDLTAQALTHRGVAEVEAESVAHIVLASHGVATDEFSLPYIAGWSDGTSAVVAATADRVLKCAKQVLATTEKAEEVVAA